MRVLFYCLAMPEIAPVSQSVSKGWRALSRGSWKEARAIFEQELEVGESATALEGLSWAAWWLDDADMVFGARERAYRLYRKGQDPASAARMATWLAADHLDFHGALAVASGWLRRAGRLLEPLEPGPDHGWLAFHEGHIAGICGDTVNARELAVRAAQLGRRFEVPDLEMLGLALQGPASSLPLGSRRACAASTRPRRRPWRERPRSRSRVLGPAVSWSPPAPPCSTTGERSSGATGSRSSQSATGAATCSPSVALSTARSTCGGGGGRMRRRSWKPRSRTFRGPGRRGRRVRWRRWPSCDGGRGGRRRRWLLDQAGASAASQLGRARLALDRGEPLRAAELGQRLLRQLPEEGKLERAPALELLVRARIARGELEEAASALAALREIEQLVGTAPLRACTDLAEGVLAAAGGEHERARPLLEDALDCFQRSGAPFEACQVRIELATSLAALGRIDEAEREAVTARDRLVELAANAEAERAGRLLDGPIRGGGDGTRLAKVTPREYEVLKQLARGLTNRQIAERLVLSEHTVHRHVTNLLRKLHLPSRTAAAAYAARLGLLGDADV